MNDKLGGRYGHISGGVRKLGDFLALRESARTRLNRTQTSADRVAKQALRTRV